jgi:RNA polymerase sigma-70 factor, ECF subfamily
VSVHDITQLLHDARRGEHKAEDLLLERIYSELHDLAVGFLSAERPDHTLQASALVNEAFSEAVWQENHGLGEPRTLLCLGGPHHAPHPGRLRARSDSAMNETASRRQRVEMSNVLALVRERSQEFVALDQALERLAGWDARQAQSVDLRFYGGHTIQETARGGWASRRRR